VNRGRLFHFVLARLTSWQSGDTVDGMVHYELDPMFMYTVTMGVVGLLMAWVLLLLALKGWAVRRERNRHVGVRPTD
jgi:hypothetical protein